MNRVPLLAAIVFGQAALGQATPNLILNPGADGGPAGPTGYEIVAIPNWAPTGTLTAVAWSTGGGFPIVTNPGPPDRGANLFAGGPSAAVSTGTQSIDVSTLAAFIDTGAVGYQLAGWFGGFSSQEDRARLAADFRNAGGTSLGTVTIGDITAAERGSATGLFPRSANGLVPPLTRAVDLTLTMTRFAGSYNDGYADSLSFRLGALAGAGMLGTGCGAASGTPTLSTSPPALGQTLSIFVTGAPASATGELLFSAPPSAATPIGGGCVVFLDPLAFASLTPIATSGGAWSLSIGLPSDPGLAGISVVAQAYLVPGTGPFGLALTNGVLWVVGL